MARNAIDCDIAASGHYRQRRGPGEATQMSVSLTIGCAEAANRLHRAASCMNAAPKLLETHNGVLTANESTVLLS